MLYCTMEFIRKDLLWNDFLNEKSHPGLPLPFSGGEDPFAPAPTYPWFDFTQEEVECSYPSACIDPMWTLGIHPSLLTTTIEANSVSSPAIEAQLPDAPTPNSNTSRDSTPLTNHNTNKHPADIPNGPASLVPASLATIFSDSSSVSNSPMAIALASTPHRKSASAPLSKPKRRGGAPYPTSSGCDTSADRFIVRDGIPVLVVTNPGHLPPTAVYLCSSPDAITSEAAKLSNRLRQHTLSSIAHHPCMTCPVFDCPLGGWNTLLHGPYPTSEDEEDREAGKFFTTNEIMRHVRSKHTPPTDLRCDHHGCATQRRLDEKALDGVGKFCRLDVFKAHFKEHPAHKQSLSEELKVKYNL